MLNGLYSAGSAMEAAARRHEVISQNLAHAHMPGYRKQNVMHTSKEANFDDTLRSAFNFEAYGVNADKTATDFSAGPMQRTNHPLDMAIQGEGFFVVQGPNGPLYTRNGAFQLDSTGRLVTGDQLPVLGSSGEIEVPINTNTSTIRVEMDGTVFAGATEVGKLQIVDFPDPQRLQQTGITLYAAPQDMQPNEIDATIYQNMREGSNVSPIQELVDLIAAQRQQEAAQRSMTLITESIGKNINVQGR